MTIPHLGTAQMVQSDFERTIIEQHTQIETWFREQWQGKKPLITCSVDLRNALFKVAPIDTNVFPAGFNNLNPDFHPLCVQAMQATLSHAYTGCKTVGIIPESHTRNQFYLNNLESLQDILWQAGFDAVVGTLRDINKPEQLAVHARKLTQYPIKRVGDELFIGDTRPCLVVLNHDLSGGLPEILKGIKQPIVPPIELGWDTRSKLNHFLNYQKICATFCQAFELDPFRLGTLVDMCDHVDFSSSSPNPILIEKAEQLFSAIQSKYKAFGIKEQPYIVIKSDTGTYGMAVMSIDSPEALKNLNRKQRNKMSTGKGGEAVTRVLLQEGVPTRETRGPTHAAAEPVIYMIGEFVVGGFYRLHKDKGTDESLNAPGMSFEPLAFDDCCHTPDARLKTHAHKNLFYVYSVIARLAHLATLMEQTS